MNKVACNHKCFDVLGNKLRYTILLSLKKQPKTVGNLCESLKKEQSGVSHALKQLRKCNFVDYKQNGKEKEYYLKSTIFTNKKTKTLFEIFDEHRKTYCECDECEGDKNGFIL